MGNCGFLIDIIRHRPIVNDVAKDGRFERKMKENSSVAGVLGKGKINEC